MVKRNNNYKYALYILTLNGVATPEIGASNSFSGIEWLVFCEYEEFTKTSVL